MSITVNLQVKRITNYLPTNMYIIISILTRGIDALQDSKSTTGTERV